MYSSKNSVEQSFKTKNNQLSKRTVIIALFFLFFASLAVRLFFAFQTPYLSDSESYFNLRQIEEIKATGLPVYDDPLSFGGRKYVFLPFFHYTVAFFSLFFPLGYLVKILPNLFASSLIFIVYLCSFEITKSRESALFSAAIASFIPIYAGETFNALDPYTLALPLSFLLLYVFYNISNPRYIKLFLVLLVVALITHPSLVFLILGLTVFYLISKIEDLPRKQEELEIILFSILLSLWFYFLIFKDAFLQHGFKVIRHNIPPQLLEKVFHQITVLEGVTAVGLIPLLAGIYVVYLYIFKRKSKLLYLIISFLLTITTLLWLELISVKGALMYISVLVVLLCGEAYGLFMNYIEKTKFAEKKKYLSAMIIIIFILTSFIPMLTLMKEKIRGTITEDEVAALQFLRENTRPDQKIAAPVNEGHYIAYFAQRTNVADTHFLQARDAAVYVGKLELLFNTRSKIVASQIMNDLDAQLIYLSKRTQAELNIDELPTADESCLPVILLHRDVKVYRSRCSS